MPIHFLDRIELYDTVKPYNIHFYPREDFPRHNLQHSEYQTRIRSIRTCQPAPSLDANGFEVINIKTTMLYSDFTNPATIEATYCREMEDQIKKILGANHVQVLDYQVYIRPASYSQEHAKCEKPNN